MGLKESLMSDFKGYTIEYQGKKLYVIDQLEYKNDTYLCVLHIDKIPEAVVDFLKKEKDSIFKHVTDDKLFDELVLKLGENTVIEEIEKVKKDIINK